MDDSFSFGTPSKGRTRAYTEPEHEPKHARPARSIERTRLMLGVAALAVAAVLVWGFLHFMGSAGNEIGADQQRVVGQIGNAQDVQAQLTSTQAISTVQTLYAQASSFGAITPQALKAFEPAYTYTASASTDPNTVSVAQSSTGVGLAVMSASGTCLYAHVSATGTTYGTGSTCTGDAALDASLPAWPSEST